MCQPRLISRGVVEELNRGRALQGDCQVTRYIRNTYIDDSSIRQEFRSLRLPVDRRGQAELLAFTLVTKCNPPIGHNSPRTIGIQPTGLTESAISSHIVRRRYIRGRARHSATGRPSGMPCQSWLNQLKALCVRIAI